MNFYNQALVHQLSMEGVKKTSDPGVVAQPEGDVELNITMKAENGDATQHNDLDDLIRTLSSQPYLSAEGHRPDLATEFFIADKSNRDNLVVNGVYLPDYVLDKKLDVRVVVINKNTRLNELDKETVYFVLDEAHSADLVKVLIERGYYAAANPLDLASVVDRFRIYSRQAGL